MEVPCLFIFFKNRFASFHHLSCNDFCKDSIKSSDRCINKSQRKEKECLFEFGVNFSRSGTEESRIIAGVCQAHFH